MAGEQSEKQYCVKWMGDDTLVWERWGDAVSQGRHLVKSTSTDEQSGGPVQDIQEDTGTREHLIKKYLSENYIYLKKEIQQSHILHYSQTLQPAQLPVSTQTYGQYCYC